MNRTYRIIPNKDELQTNEIQKIFDLCKDTGGTIIFTKGRYLFSSIYVYSNTTIVLEEGALLFGSREVDDYILFDIPKGMQMRCDMQMIPEYYQNKPWDNYRKAMFTAYQERNIKITGTGIIDGQNCVDINGEEGYRGPHGIFFSNCENITLENYTIQNNGNFMHQLDVCRNVNVNNVHCIGGSDGFHLHECQNVKIYNSKFETGDDCVAGINIKDLHINNCYFNTSCDVFRIGGNDILIENSLVVGPGKYPHRKTIFVDKDHFLPISEGRHNTICLLIYFASMAFPTEKDSDNIVFRNIQVKDVDMFLVYNPNCNDLKYLQNGNDLVGVTLKNVSFEGLKYPSNFDNSNHKPLKIKLQNVKSNMPLFNENVTNIELVK